MKIWEGPSVFDNEPIMAVLTFKSGDRKTGPMTQLWALRKDRAPLEASKEGAE